MMLVLLARAAGPDASNSDLVGTVTALLIIAGAGVLAIIPFALARRRAHRRIDGMAACLVLWAIVSAGSAVYWTNARMKWSQEYDLRVATGDFDPRDQSGRPSTPWLLFGGVAAAYAALMIWAAWARVERGTIPQ